jgi:hypothetical protein
MIRDERLKEQLQKLVEAIEDGNEEDLDVDDRRIYREAHGHLSHYNSGYSSKWKESEMVFPKKKIRGE